MDIVIPIKTEPLKQRYLYSSLSGFINAYPFNELISMVNLKNLITEGAEFFETYEYLIDREIRHSFNSTELQSLFADIEVIVQRKANEALGHDYRNYYVTHLRYDYYQFRKPSYAVYRSHL